MSSRKELPAVRQLYPDDSLSTPWSVPTPRFKDSITRDQLPQLSTRMSTSASGNRSVYMMHVADNNTSASPSDGDQAARVREKIRRLLIQQRKKYKELVKLEDDGFKNLLRQADHSVESISAFMEFQRKKKESEERYRALMLPWIVETLSHSIERLIQEEQERRQVIVLNERRVRKARERFECATGARMRFERSVAALFRMEESCRRYIQRAEMHEARSIPLLRPFVVVFDNLSVLGQCPFVSLQDCPFYCRGEGVRNPHYAYSKRANKGGPVAAGSPVVL